MINEYIIKKDMKGNINLRTPWETLLNITHLWVDSWTWNLKNTKQECWSLGRNIQHIGHKVAYQMTKTGHILQVSIAHTYSTNSPILI
jgi:hypothetical protein